MNKNQFSFKENRQSFFFGGLPSLGGAPASDPGDKAKAKDKAEKGPSLREKFETVRKAFVDKISLDNIETQGQKQQEIILAQVANILKQNSNLDATPEEIKEATRNYALGKYKNAKENEKSKKIIKAIIKNKDILEAHGIEIGFSAKTDGTEHRLVKDPAWHKEKAAALRTLLAATKLTLVNFNLDDPTKALIEEYCTKVESNGDYIKFVSDNRDKFLNGGMIFDAGLNLQRATDMKKRIFGKKAEMIADENNLTLDFGTNKDRLEERKSGITFSVTEKPETEPTLGRVEIKGRMITFTPKNKTFEVVPPKGKEVVLKVIDPVKIKIQLIIDGQAIGILGIDSNGDARTEVDKGKANVVILDNNIFVYPPAAPEYNYSLEGNKLTLNYIDAKGQAQEIKHTIEAPKGVKMFVGRDKEDEYIELQDGEKQGFLELNPANGKLQHKPKPGAKEQFFNFYDAFGPEKKVIKIVKRGSVLVQPPAPKPGTTPTPQPAPSIPPAPSQTPTTTPEPAPEDIPTDHTYEIKGNKLLVKFLGEEKKPAKKYTINFPGDKELTVIKTKTGDTFIKISSGDLGGFFEFDTTTRKLKFEKSSIQRNIWTEYDIALDKFIIRITKKAAVKPAPAPAPAKTAPPAPAPVPAKTAPPAPAPVPAKTAPPAPAPTPPKVPSKAPATDYEYKFKGNKLSVIHNGVNHPYKIIAPPEVKLKLNNHQGNNYIIASIQDGEKYISGYFEINYKTGKLEYGESGNENIFDIYDIKEDLTSKPAKIIITKKKSKPTTEFSTTFDTPEVAGDNVTHFEVPELHSEAVEEKQIRNLRKFVAKGISIVDFSGTDCLACRAMKPWFHEIAKSGLRKGSEKVKFANFNFEKMSLGNGVIQQFNIDGFPTIIIFKDGKELGRFSGASDKATLETQIKEIIG